MAQTSTRSGATTTRKRSDATNARWRRRNPFTSFDEAKQTIEQQGLESNNEVQFFGHRKKVTCLAWNCEGGTLASGSSDFQIVLHRTDSPSALRYPENDQATKLTGHTADVVSLSWHPTAPQVLVSGSEDGLKMWDLRRETKQASVWSLEKERLTGCKFCHSGNLMAVADANALQVYDVRKVSTPSSPVHEIQVERRQQPFDFCWTNTNDHILMANKEGAIDIYDVREGLTRVHSFTSHIGICYCVEMSPSGDFICTGGADGVVSVWTSQDLCCIRTFPQYLTDPDQIQEQIPEPVKCLNFSFDSQLVATANYQKSVTVTWIANGETVKDISVQANVTALAWNPKHYFLAYACEDKRYENYLGNMKIWGVDIWQ